MYNAAGGNPCSGSVVLLCAAVVVFIMSSLLHATYVPYAYVLVVVATNNSSVPTSPCGGATRTT